MRISAPAPPKVEFRPSEAVFDSAGGAAVITTGLANEMPELLQSNSPPPVNHFASRG